MGQSPSADVFWGYDIGKFEDPETYESTHPAWWWPDGEDGDPADWEEVYAERVAGWKPVPFPASASPSDYSLSREEREIRRIEWQKTPEYKAWSENLGRKHEILGNCPVALEQTGYEDEPMFCVRIKRSVQSVSDWEVVPFDPPVTQGEWFDQINVFMVIMEFQIPETPPRWYMSCNYG